MAERNNPFIEQDSQSTRRLNLQRKKLRCLGCGRAMLTDRCHRFCGICMRRNRRSQCYDLKLVRIAGITHESESTALLNL